MSDTILKPYDLETELTGYLPIPRELLDMELPSTAVLIYGALLDRSTLSRKNRYADAKGWVYAIYTLDHLSQTLHISGTAVKRHLKTLEDRGLIRRCRTKRNAPSQIYLNLPTGSRKGTSCPGEGAKKDHGTGTKVPPNNRRKQHNFSDYYQHGEEESL